MKNGTHFVESKKGSPERIDSMTGQYEQASKAACRLIKRLEVGQEFTILDVKCKGVHPSVLGNVLADKERYFNCIECIGQYSHHYKPYPKLACKKIYVKRYDCDDCARKARPPIAVVSIRTIRR